MYQIYHIAGAEILQAPESALLDRRVFGWLYAAGTEAKLFPSTAGDGFDKGFDADPPQTLTAYIREAQERSSPTKHVHWLRCADKGDCL